MSRATRGGWKPERSTWDTRRSGRMTAHLPGAAERGAELGAELGVELGGDEAGLAGELGATFDHVAIAGRRIRAMLPLWRDTLGGRVVVGADNPEIGWRAGPVR